MKKILLFCFISLSFISTVWADNIKVTQDPNNQYRFLVSASEAGTYLAISQMVNVLSADPQNNPIRIKTAETNCNIGQPFTQTEYCVLTLLANPKYDFDVNITIFADDYSMGASYHTSQNFTLHK